MQREEGPQQALHQAKVFKPDPMSVHPRGKSSLQAAACRAQSCNCSSAGALIAGMCPPAPCQHSEPCMLLKHPSGPSNHGIHPLTLQDMVTFHLIWQHSRCPVPVLHDLCAAQGQQPGSHHVFQGQQQGLPASICLVREMYSPGKACSRSVTSILVCIEMRGHAAEQSPGALCLAASAASKAARCCSVRKGCELWCSTPLAAAECCALDTA